jgi:hypothetical protein
MSDKPAKSPWEEGASTLAAQFTRHSVNHIIRQIQDQRKKGVPEAEIEANLEKNLAAYDSHSRTMLLKLSRGENIPDDFLPANILESKQTKDNTLILSFYSVPEGIRLYSLVRYCQKEWLVVWIEKQTLTLKLLN